MSTRPPSYLRRITRRDHGGLPVLRPPSPLLARWEMTAPAPLAAATPTTIGAPAAPAAAPPVSAPKEEAAEPDREGTERSHPALSPSLHFAQDQGQGHPLPLRRRGTLNSPLPLGAAGRRVRAAQAAAVPPEPAVVYDGVRASSPQPPDVSSGGVDAIGPDTRLRTRRPHRTPPPRFVEAVVTEETRSVDARVENRVIVTRERASPRVETSPAISAPAIERVVQAAVAVRAPARPGPRNAAPLAPRVHIGSIEVRIQAPPPAAPPEQRPAAAVRQRPAASGPLSRGFTSPFGLKQG